MNFKIFIAIALSVVMLTLSASAEDSAVDYSTDTMSYTDLVRTKDIMIKAGQVINAIKENMALLIDMKPSITDQISPLSKQATLLILDLKSSPITLRRAQKALDTLNTINNQILQLF
jgi:hypothetical protein